ncbi:hypothetical protein F5X68DRAFT_258041 [Plectosphaerella plurivora]|uniref:Uncharacterized protein n=1 Tax=Plectosphaerella plurivora TaxID=936078 RepID=A0A9P8VLJ8_9PEZI|nr:hypothetical protein F5X68DRAFT_258041 [Plectosphaerella plurivora]
MSDFTNAELRSSQETSSEFVGWHVGQRTSPFRCNTGGEFTTSADGVAGCCYSSNLVSDGGCGVATDCAGTGIFYNDGTRRSCANETECQVIDLFENYVPGSLPDSSFRLAFCRSTTWDRRTMYMRIGEATATSSSESSATEPSTNSAPNPTSSDDASSVEEEVPSSGASKAWIAGAVIGPLFLIALVVLGIWWYKRRSKAKAAAVSGQHLPGGGPTHSEAKHHSQQPIAPGYEQQPYMYDPHYQGDPRWSGTTGSPPLSASPYQPAMQQNGQWAELGANRPTAPPVELPTQQPR